MLTKREEALEAISKSIKHWEKDILKPLLKGNKIIKTAHLVLVWENNLVNIPFRSGDCPLCQNYLIDDSCRKCPYSIYYGNPCYFDDHGKEEAWFKFAMNPNTETAKAMIEKLKELKQFYS